MKRTTLKEIIRQVVREQQDAPRSDIEYITPATAADLIYGSKGAMFDVVFIKKDGTPRRMNARLGVKKHLKGGTLKFDPKEKGYVVVYDVQCGLKAQSDDDKACYRMINLNTIKSIRIGRQKYVVGKKEENSVDPK